MKTQQIEEYTEEELDPQLVVQNTKKTNIVIKHLRDAIMQRTLRNWQAETIRGLRKLK